MSLESVLEILKERGLELFLNDLGKPAFKFKAGQKEGITDALREAVAAYREEIVEWLKPPPCREFLFPLGQVAVACRHLGPNEYASGAWYWRWRGEADWWPIPGKTWCAEESELMRTHAEHGHEKVGAK